FWGEASGKLRYSGISVTPAKGSKVRWHGNWKAVDQSSKPGMEESNCEFNVVSSGTRGGVKANQESSSVESSTATRRTTLASSGISSSAMRRLRHLGEAPTSRSSSSPVLV